MPIFFFFQTCEIMKGTTTQTVMEVTTALKFHCVLANFIEIDDSFTKT